MPVIDNHGRVFGTINLIDAIVGLFVLALIPLAYGAFLLFRVPVPEIMSIEPAQVVQHKPVTVRMTGRNLRPFLSASLGTTESLGFLIQSPGQAEIKLPDLPAGTYDLVLYDQAQELVRKPGALTVVMPPPPRNRLATLRVRFVVRPQVLDLVKVGDVDVGAAVTAVNSGTDPGEEPRAELTTVGSERQTMTVRTGVEAGPGRSYQFDQTVTAFEATVRVRVEPTPAGWRYKGKLMKVGGPFAFETNSYVMDGWILSMNVES